MELAGIDTAPGWACEAVDPLAEEAHRLLRHRLDGLRDGRQRRVEQVRPGRLVIANNLMTIGAVQLLRERGLRIPEDVAIVAIDDPVDADWLRAWRATLDCGDERRAVDRQEPAWFEMANFGGVGDGGNMAFRRRAFDIWPGFHERLGRAWRAPRARRTAIW